MRFALRKNDQPTSQMGGEAYFALAMERRLWQAHRSFPRRTPEARFPPN
jgi:hypothetical protein